ncbi:MAG: hypothetical protein EOR30_22855 [Mesorhizobium sp.]|uniref:hypothetical protein n=1 Tax=unclassified Mesorhizobium TaxID=325217 RepID=UPI000FCAC600|nr:MULTISPECIES: hypothetical protein [unclassified Mesorhizobium]RUV74373.1 hypothetical protein EOA78_09300 [Mesorhizobium sp. M5C.F.Cr.IN.023.01.1.1]RWF86106.1 MAG: hypothetical protein EOQ36_19035 [Mesorhizobium sp.]RWF94373.1 MAG: hypothetical protein EOQ45_12605 [Mesorhizobium sp.]RWI38333.1 MAG: hypothetical protein EOR14_22045 [Mesorhizobium sp.]RWI45500.1 MAG: hypothetical protein EOR15_21200 [Mesorhizobium sp.]
MRHILSSFLALHWAVVFALLAFLCIDGNRGVAAALGVLGVAVQNTRFADLENAVVVAPLAVALLVVAVLFCWAFVETLFSGPTNPDATDSVVRVAFISASGVLSLIVVGGAAQGINGLFMVVAVQLAALLASYVAMLAERRSALGAAVPGTGKIRAAAHVMAKAAAHNSALSRISGRLATNLRPDTNLRDGR